MNLREVWAVDFDGTICSNAWPKIGEPTTELIEQIIEARRQGIAVILWTCREGKAQADAVLWCAARGLFFDAVNENVPERKAYYGEDSRKVSADRYIDDRAQLPPLPLGGDPL